MKREYRGIFSWIAFLISICNWLSNFPLGFYCIYKGSANRVQKKELA